MKHSSTSARPSKPRGRIKRNLVPRPDPGPAWGEDFDDPIDGETEPDVKPVTPTPKATLKAVAAASSPKLKPRSELDYGPELLEDDEDAESDDSPEVSGPTIEQLEAALGRQGKITRTLGSSTYQLNDSKWQQENGLGRHLSSILQQVVQGVPFDFHQVQMEFLDRTFKDAKSARRAVIAACNREGFDSVLAYAIFEHSGLTDVGRAIEEQAIATYIAHADEYDLVLRNLIPQKFKERAADPVAKRKYWNGTNATAREDWEFFLTQYNDQPTGLTTGLSSLDTALGGGINNLTIIGANEADGKTSLSLHIVVSALRADPDLDCLFLSIDQPKKDTLAKLYSLVTGCDRDTLKLPSDKRATEVNNQIREGVAELKDHILPRMRFVEKVNLSRAEEFTYDTFYRYYWEMNRKTQATQGILVVDMFQNLDRFPNEVVMDNDKDDYRLEIIRQFRQATKSDVCPDGFPVIVTSEIRKAERDDLSANDLRGSARLGSYPENILLLWPPANTDQHADVVPRILKIAKARHGYESILHVGFHHTISRFTDIPPEKRALPGPIEGRGTARSRGLDRRNAM